LELLRGEYPNLSDATLTWRIHDLKSRGVLYSAGRGLYVLDPPAAFQPVLASTPRRMMNRLLTDLPGADCCLSETNWLNEVLPSAEPLPKLSFTLIEVEKAHLETAYGLLLGFSRTLFLNPDATEVERFVRLHDRAIVLRLLVSEAPKITVNGTPVSSLEKMLVDALVHTDLYSDYQPRLRLLLHNAHDHFALNLDRLRRYARRRDKLNELNELL
jgi:hypothetical protein